MAKIIVSETDSPYVAPVVYGIASLVGLARLNDNEHWSSDAFFGAVIGYFTAAAVLRYHKQSSPVSLMPSVSRDGCGVLVVYRY
jgi:membrane-associated phospholipid phosphatase